MAENSSYRNIFKTTFLFGFVQVFNILIKVGTNKAIAIFLGSEGMGIIGLFNSAINLLKTGAGLGVSQSAVRDISEANAQNDKIKFSSIITLTNNIIIFTSLSGIIITIIISPFLSKWSFGNNSYTIAFIWVSTVVGMNILSEGQLAILKGMRQLGALAKASIFGSVAGLLSAIPFYYFLGKSGIVPSLIITSFVTLFFSNLFVRKIQYKKIRFSFKEIYKDSSPMIKMGISLMLVSFIGYLFDLIIITYISKYGGLEDVGYYHAGTTIISSYFGVVITAMQTDYYPRISAVYKDNEKLKIEMNRQSETGLVMIFPLVVLFVFFSSFFIRFLYSSEFGPTSLYTDYAMIGTIIIIVSNCMGMILIAKQASNIFIYSVLIQRILLIIVYILAYNNLGLMGLGISYIITGILHITIMAIILKRNYDIKPSTNIIKLLFIVLTVTIVSIFARSIDSIFIKYISGSILLFFSILYSYYYMRNKMGIDLMQTVKSKIKKEK